MIRREKIIKLNCSVVDGFIFTPQTEFYSEDFASVGLRNMLIVDKRKQWLVDIDVLQKNLNFVCFCCCVSFRCSSFTLHSVTVFHSRGLFGRSFPYTSHVIFTDLTHSNLNDVRKETFNSKRSVSDHALLLVLGSLWVFSVVLYLLWRPQPCAWVKKKCHCITSFIVFL